MMILDPTPEDIKNAHDQYEKALKRILNLLDKEYYEHDSSLATIEDICMEALYD